MREKDVCKLRGDRSDVFHNPDDFFGLGVAGYSSDERSMVGEDPKDRELQGLCQALLYFNDLGL